jgi:hypothetical protein
MADPEELAFDRGHVAGAIAARLKAHDEHFAKINGSVERTADELGGVKLALERLTAQAMTTGVSAMTTEAARSESERVRLANVEPWAKTAVWLLVLVLLALGLLFYVTLAR